jgi:hypothetical protein
MKIILTIIVASSMVGCTTGSKYISYNNNTTNNYYETGNEIYQQIPQYRVFRDDGVCQRRVLEIHY